MLKYLSRIFRGTRGLAADVAVLPGAASEVAPAGVMAMAKKKRRKPAPPPVRKKPRRGSSISQAAKTVKFVSDPGQGGVLDFWRGSVVGAGDWARLALLAGGLLAVLYLAFSSGGYFFARSAHAEIFLLYLVVLGLLFNLQVPGKPGRVGWLLLGSFAAFALWNLSSMAWSFAPAASLDEFIRALMYLTAMVLFYLFLARPRWLEWMGNLYVAIAVLVGAWALMGKVLPAVIAHDAMVAKYFQHNRLTFPLSYWNALAIFMIMAVPLALRVASDQKGRLAWRGLALAATFLLLTVIFFTFSRAGYLVLLPVLSIQLLCASRRLRFLALAGLAFFWTALLVTVSFIFLPAMLANAPGLSDKVSQGRLFGVLLLAVGLLAFASILPVSRLERSVRLAPAAGKKIGYALSALAAILVLAVVGAIFVKAGGPVDLARNLTDIVSEREASGSVETSQKRLLSLQSERYQEYAVSLSTLAENPLAGTGAGTWFVNWNRERPLFYNPDGEPYEVNARDGHSWLLESLAELGLVGGALLLAFIAAFTYIAVRDLRLLGRSREREVYGAFLAACAALLLHAMVDWDWEMPAVMLPFFMFAGGLLRYGTLSRSEDEGLVSPAEGGEAAGWRRFFNWRLLLGAACLLAMAVVVPLWMSERYADNARSLYEPCKERYCGQGIYMAVRQNADNARRFNPFSAEPLFLEAASWQLEAVDLNEKGANPGNALSEAERLMQQALEIEPYNDDYYRKLTIVYLGQNRIDEAAAAIRRARELNPYETQETGKIEQMVLEAGGKI